MAAQGSRLKNALAIGTIAFSISAVMLVAWHFDRWASPGLLQYVGTSEVPYALQLDLSSDRPSIGSMVVPGDAVAFVVVTWSPAQCQVAARGVGARNGVVYTVYGCPGDAEFLGTISPPVPSLIVRLTRLR